MRLLFSFIIAALTMACMPVDTTNDNQNETPTPLDTTAVDSGSKPDEPKEDVNEEPENDQVDEDAYNDFERIALQSEIKNVQPMTGIVLWTDNSRVESKKEYIQLEYAYMLYNQVCKEKDVYDWTPMDNLLDEVASRGHQLVVRFRYSYVGKQCSVPDYIKEWPGYEETVGKSEGRTTYFPDWRCEELQRFHLEFHKRFAERYDNDPRLAFVQTGFGLWAEYHIYDGPFKIGQTFPSKEFQAKFFREMENYFKSTTWSISIDAADPTYSPLSAQKDLLDIRFGNFDDSFMHESHNEYNRDCWLFFGLDRYKKAPCGGEFSYYSTYDQQHCLDKAGMYGRVFEDQVAEYHMSYIIGNDQPNYQSMDRIKEASIAMGYSYEILDYRVKGNEAAVLIKNIGVAPIYRDTYVSINGNKGSYNLKDLMPDRSVWVVIKGDGVSSDAKPQIVSEHLVKGQKIEYRANVK